MTTTITRNQIDKWVDEHLNKPCPIHPHSLLKSGKWDVWCGNKVNSKWCNGGEISEEWIKNNPDTNG